MLTLKTYNFIEGREAVRLQTNELVFLFNLIVYRAVEHFALKIFLYCKPYFKTKYKIVFKIVEKLCYYVIDDHWLRCSQNKLLKSIKALFTIH